MKNKSLYRDIFKRALSLTWKNPFLWIFGFFTTFLGIGNVYETIFKNSIEQSALLDKLGVKFSLVSFYGVFLGKNFTNITFGNLLLLIGVLIIILVVFGIALWASIGSLGGLIHATNHLDKKKKTNFVSSFKDGYQHFWKLFAVNVMGKTLIILFLALTSGLLALLLTNTSVINSIIFFLSFLVFVSISLFISFIIVYASAFVILKKKGVIDSIHEAWQLFKNNWVVTIETAVILFILDILVKISLVIITAIFSLPFILFLLLSFTFGITLIAQILMFMWILFIIAVLVIASSIFSSYQLVAWILLFDKITKGGVLSKLHRIFRK